MTHGDKIESENNPAPFNKKNIMFKLSFMISSWSSLTQINLFDLGLKELPEAFISLCVRL